MSSIKRIFNRKTPDSFTHTRYTRSLFHAGIKTSPECFSEEQL